MDCFIHYSPVTFPILSKYPLWTDSFTIPLSRSLCLSIEQ